MVSCEITQQLPSFIGANLGETQDAQEEEYEMVGIPKRHPPESLLIRPSVIPSILQPAHRAIVHGKATGDPVELLMKCLKFKKFMALWNMWRIWRILGSAWEFVHV